MRGSGQQLGLVDRDPDPADRGKVIDMINRLNTAFDRWDIEAMVEVFTEDCILHHPHGVVRGHEELRRFYEAYRPLTLGVRRHNTNHIVDANDDGTLTATSFMTLVRIAPSDSPPLATNDITRHDGALPGLFTHASITDRFRRDAGVGWRFAERWVEETVANTQLRPVA